jgi:predicted Zn-dependent protease
MPDLTIVENSPQIKRGIELVDAGRLDAAAKHFSALWNATQGQNPVIASFIGMLKAVRDNQLFQGLEICKKAVAQDADEPLCYLNLAKVYMAMNDRYHAVQMIQKGLKRHTPTREILYRYYQSIGIRKKPPIGFLDRNNPVNKVLGKLKAGKK